MAWIPIICGTYGNSEVLGVGADCPVCRQRDTGELVHLYSRCCFCFLPLCKVGGDSYSAHCTRCGASMPSSVATQSRRFTNLAPAAALREHRSSLSDAEQHRASHATAAAADAAPSEETASPFASPQHPLRPAGVK